MQFVMEPPARDSVDQSPQSISKKLFESEGVIGFQNNGMFVPVTNFYLCVTGFVMKEQNEKTAKGFLIEVVPKDNIPLMEDFDDSLQDLCNIFNCYFYLLKHCFLPSLCLTSHSM